MPQVSRAQTVTWKYQSTWPTKDIFHEFAVDYAKKVNDMSGGRLQARRARRRRRGAGLPDADAVHSGVLDAGHGVCAYWYGKHKAYSLFGTPPSFGWDAHGMLGWFYSAAARRSTRNSSTTSSSSISSASSISRCRPSRSAGSRRRSRSADDFKGMKYRTVGLSADLFKEMGAAVTILPGGEIVPAMDRGLLDAAEFNNPSSDILLGFPDVSKFFMMGSHHQQAEAFEIIFNKAEVRRAAAGAEGDPAQRGLRRHRRPVLHGHDRYSKDLEEIKKRGVQRDQDAGRSVLNAQLAGLGQGDRRASRRSRSSRRSIDSQKAWVKRTSAYLHVNNLSTRRAARRPTSTSSADRIARRSRDGPRGRCPRGPSLLLSQLPAKRFIVLLRYEYAMRPSPRSGGGRR